MTNDDEKPARIPGVLVEIQTEHLPNTSLERLHLDQPVRWNLRVVLHVIEKRLYGTNLCEWWYRVRS
jgi:hypothetical protein